MGSLLLLDASALLYRVWKDEDELGGRAAGGRHFPDLAAEIQADRSR